MIGNVIWLVNSYIDTHMAIAMAVITNRNLKSISNIHYSLKIQKLDIFGILKIRIPEVLTLYSL